MYTLGPFVLALQVPDGTAPLPSPPGAGSDVVQLIAQANPLNQAVLAILVVFSVASWAIIVYKTMVFRRSRQQSQQFIAAFRKSSKLSEVQVVCATLSASPLVGVFQAGYAELNAQFRLTAGDGVPGEAGGRPLLKSLTAVDRALLRAATSEVGKLEHRLAFLATTASITPFIGLFGTVVGIMLAFFRIGQTGSTNLAVVGPGISEALIATAAGLFAAIPAVYFYNSLTTNVKGFASEMDDF